MSDVITRSPASAPTYAPPTSQSELVAEYISLLLAGKPFPPHLRSTAPATRRPSSCEEELESIVMGAF